MPYGLNKYSQTTDSYQNKKMMVKGYGGYSGYGSYGGYNNFKRVSPREASPSSVSLSDLSSEEFGILRRSIAKRSNLDRIFDVLQTGQYIVQGQIRAGIDPELNRFEAFGKAVMSANPFGEDYREGEYTFGENLNLKFGEPTTKLGKVGRFITGLAGDILLDPLTYVSLGTGAVVKGTGTKVAKGLGVVDDVAVKLTKKQAIQSLSDAGQAITSESIERLMKTANKYAGIQEGGRGFGFKLGKLEKTFVDADTLRKLGDKTIAPYTKSITDYLGSTKLGRNLNAKYDIQRFARVNPEEFARKLLVVDIVKGHTDSAIKSIDKINTRSREMFSMFDEDEMKDLFKFLEDGKSFARNSVKVDINDKVGAKAIYDKIDELMSGIDSRLAERRDRIKKYSNIDTIKSYVGVDFNVDLLKTNNELQILNEYKDDLLNFKKNIETVSNTRFPIKRLDIDDAPIVYDEINGTKLFTSKEEAIESMAPFDVSKPTGIGGTNKALKADSYFTYADEINNKIISRHAKLPYGVSALEKGKKFQLQNGYVGTSQELFSKSISDYGSMDSAKKAWGTSKKAVDKAIESGDVGVMRTTVERLIKNNPMLSYDFRRVKLASNLDEKQLKKFLSDYYSPDVKAGQFLNDINKYKEGYDMARHMAQDAHSYKQLFAEAEEFKRLNPGAQLTPDLKRRFKEYYRQIDRYLIDEDYRLGDYVKYIEKGGAKLSNKSFDDMGKSMVSLRKRINAIDDKIKLGTATADEVTQIDGLKKRLIKESRNFEDIKVRQKALDEVATILDDKYIDDILKDEGPYKLTYGDDSYVDYRDAELISRDEEMFKAQADLINSTKKVSADDILEAKRGTPQLKQNKQYSYLDKFNRLEKIREGIITKFSKKNISEANNKTLEDALARVDDRLAKLMKDITDSDADNELVDLLLDTKAKTETDIANLLEKLENSHWSENSTLTRELASLEQSLLKQTETLDNVRARISKDPMTREKIVSQYAKANGLSNALEVDMYSSMTDNKTIADLLNATEKPLRADAKLALLKQYFPDKRYKDLTKMEMDFIEGKLYDMAEKGEILHSRDFRNDWTKGLKNVDAKLAKVDKQMAQLQRKVDRTKNLYHKAHTEWGTKAQDMLKARSRKNIEKSITYLKEEKAKLVSAIENSRIEEYMRGRLSPENFNELFYKFDDGSFLDPDLERRFGKVARMFTEDMRKIAIAEGLDKTIDNYVAHIVKPEHLKLGKEEWNELLSHIGVGINDFNPHELSRRLNMTIEEYHKAWDAGKFNMLPRDLFEDNLAKVYTTRMLTSNKLIAERENYKTVLNLLGKRVDLLTPVAEGKVRVASVGDIKNMYWELRSNMNKLDLKPEELERFANTFGVQDRVADLKSPFWKLSVEEEQMLAYYSQKVDARLGVIDSYPAVINEFTATAKYQYSEGIRSFLDTYDKMLHLWKMSVTVVNPNFHIRNAIGNVFNNYLDMGIKSADPKFNKLVYDIGKGVDGVLITKSGKEIPYSEIRAAANQLKIADEGFFGWEIRHRQKNVALGDTLLTPKFNPINETEFLPYKYGTKIGGIIENHGKMANFVHHIQEGKTYTHAKTYVDKFLFDYSVGTEFEQEVMKRVIPFWTWMKNNAPLQAEMMLSKPQRYFPFAKIRDEFEVMVDADDRIDRAYVNDFARDWWQLPGNITNEDGREESIMFNPNLPYQDLSVGVKDVLGKISPFIKVPIEFASNKHSFYEQPIFTDDKPAGVSAVDHIASQFTQINFAKSVARKQGSDRMLEILAYFSGMRIMSYDAEKYKYMKLVEELEKQRGEK